MSIHPTIAQALAPIARPPYAREHAPDPHTDPYRAEMRLADAAQDLADIRADFYGDDFTDWS